MDKRNKFVKLLLAGVLGFCFAAVTLPKNDKIVDRISPAPNIIEMPLVQSDIKYNYGAAPTEQRGEEFRNYLAASVRIGTNGGSGSGTIVYYDPAANEAYVASCGHLWGGTKTASELKNNPVSCKITTWYHNNTKLSEPKTYTADVLFWSNNRGYDSSLVKFKPDWQPEYFPIAPVNYDIPINSVQHSLGCDGAREVAHYDVEIVGYRGNDLVTRKNSPRPGRSGGGLMSDDGYYIGTCWGTSDTSSGNGVGYFTPLKSIHSVYSSNGYNWLLEITPGGWARRIPIRSESNPGMQYPNDYIPLPGPNRLPINNL